MLLGISIGRYSILPWSIRSKRLHFQPQRTTHLRKVIPIEIPSMIFVKGAISAQTTENVLISAVKRLFHCNSGNILLIPNSIYILNSGSTILINIKFAMPFLLTVNT